MKKVIIIRSIAEVEPRTRRTVETLNEDGHCVTFFALDRECTYKQTENVLNFSIKRFRFKWFKRSIGSVLVLPVWWTIIFFELLKNNYDYIHCIDLDTLPPAFIAAKIKRKKIVYEIFDYAADVYPHSYGLKFLRPLVKIIDDFLIPKVNGLIIADEIRFEQIGFNIAHKCRKIAVIYNSPKDTYVNSDKRNSPFTVFYGGILEKDRGILSLIEAVSLLPHIKLVLAGFGNLEKQVEEYAFHNDNVIFLGKIDHKTLIENTKNSDIIPCLYAPIIPNNIYASPNKFFESLMMGKPSLAYKECLFSKRLKDFECGVILTAESDLTTQIKSTIERLSNSPEYYNNMSRNARHAYLSYFSEESNRIKLKSFYSTL